MQNLHNTIKYFQKQGYIENFRVHENELCLQSGQTVPLHSVTLDEYRITIPTDDTSEQSPAVFAISAKKNGIKGILIDSFCTNHSRLELHRLIEKIPV